MKKLYMENYKRIIFAVFVVVQVLYLSNAYAQSFTLQGKVYNNSTKKPVDFSTVIILEAKVKSGSQADGSYAITVPAAGEYTLMVRSTGLKLYKEKIIINKNLVKDIYLDPLRMRGDSLVITDDRYVQKVSRRTMTRDDLKNTPASFGDAISALTSLPGVDRTDGFFGPLVIRGMRPDANRYYVDGMLIYDPLHFGGLHSIINTNLMDKIDLYSSAFPSKYGGPLAAVIDIHTVDDVKEFGGYVDVSLLSTAALVQAPIKRQVYDGETVKEENAGYFILSGRYSTFDSLAEIYELYSKARGTDKTIDEIPVYYDYQIKAKYYFDHKHAVSMLFFGGKDGFKFTSDDDETDLDEGEDPLFNDAQLDFKYRYNSLGLYYTYKLDRLKNKFMVHGGLKKTSNFINSDNPAAADWTRNYEQDIRPNVYGIKDTVSFEWIKNHADLNLNFEYTYYRFTATGVQYALNEPGIEGQIDLGDDDLIITFPLDIKETNHVFGGYLDNKFTFGGLTLVTGFRSDYLEKVDKATFDPRGLISYEFPTETTLSVAGGKYSSFAQVNPIYFNDNPDIANYDFLDPERAYHSIVGLEQAFGLYTFEVEGYYNYFYDMIVEYPHYENGEFIRGGNYGKIKTYGFELMVRKDKEQNTNDYFGWISYTYNISKEKTGITGNRIDENGNDTGVRFDPTGDEWITSSAERTHALKLVQGYTWGRHTISAKFQLYSSLPYTPIIGSEEDPDFPGRYTPIYDTENRNSKKFPVRHRLDIRYSYKKNYAWGYVSWYFEVINVYKNEPIIMEDWQYNKPYSKNNPENNPSDDLESLIIPNFGVEVKF